MLDLFGGSGSTVIAAHKTGRRARVCELDPVYCDRILAHWEAFAKDDAELIAILDEAYRTIKVNEGPKKITLSMAHAVIRALAVNAARGQLRSAQAFISLLTETERANKALHVNFHRNGTPDLRRKGALTHIR